MPYLIVGLKTDLREDKATLETLFKKKQKPITMEQGRELAASVGALK